MAVTQSMAILHLDEIPVYVEARLVVRVVGDLVASSCGHEEVLRELRVTAGALAAAVAEALRSGTDSEELYRLRQAGVALGELRALVWEAFAAGSIGAKGFDTVTIAAARCACEVRSTARGVRHRARRSVDEDSLASGCRTSFWAERPDTGRSGAVGPGDPRIDDDARSGPALAECSNHTRRNTCPRRRNA